MSRSHDTKWDVGMPYQQYQPSMDIRHLLPNPLRATTDEIVQALNTANRETGFSFRKIREGEIGFVPPPTPVNLTVEIIISGDKEGEQ